MSAGAEIVFTGHRCMVGSTLMRTLQAQGHTHRRTSDGVAIRVAPSHFPHSEVETLLGDSAEVKEKLGWTPKTTQREFVLETIRADYLYA